MADRNVKVTVRADVADFLRGANLVQDATRKMGEGAKKASGEAKTGLSGMAQHARDNREAWTTTGAALTAYGAAVTGLGAVVAKTGIEYNTLRQRSVAALTTLTGSAEAANAQMDKLDAFASTSPFARGVFIEAQQQMLGFGIEAQRVIPYLDAIQNAVAATGGSNHDIAELSRIMSQISASAKITATDLREFGNRGVDAATLIGSQMGMTGQEIRDSITAGTLDAGEALDALAAGMEQRYGGAADNVKNTMLGALDRVKAAFRDLSASAMSVFVDPDGGGLAVDGLNALADALRRFEDLPAGLRNTILGVGGLTGVVSLLGGAALLAVPRLVETYDALGRMGSAGAAAQAGLRGLPRVIGGLAAAGAVYAGMRAFTGALDRIEQSSRDAVPGINSVQRALARLAETADSTDVDQIFADLDMSSMFRGVETDIDSVADAMQRLDDPGLLLRLQDWHGSFIGITTEADHLTGALGRLDEALVSMLATDPERAVAAFDELSAGLIAAGSSAEDIARRFPLMTDALIGYEDGAASAAAQTDALADALVLLPEGTVSHLDKLRAGADALSTSIGETAAEFINLGESIGDTEVSLDEWLDTIIEQANARDAWLGNIKTLLSEGLDLGLYQALVEQGPAGAMRVQQMVDDLAAGRDISEFNELGRRMGDATVQEAADAIGQAQFPSVQLEAEIDRSTLHHEVLGMNRVIEEAGPAQIPVSTDLSAADQERARWVVETAETFGVTQLDSNPELAYRQIEDWNNYARTVEGMPLLNADPTLAQGQLDRWHALAAITEGVAILNANQAPAGSVLAGWQSAANLAFGTATLYANAGPAQGTLQWFLSQIPSSVTIGLNAVATGLGALYRADGGPINRASGGPVHGPGGPRDDLVPAYNINTGQAYRLSNNEHVWTANEVGALGGHGEMYRLRKAVLAGAVRYDIGGQVGAAYQSRQVYSAPAAAAGPSQVDTGQIAAAVAGAMSSWQPMVSIDGRQFHGVMLKAAAGARRAGG